MRRLAIIGVAITIAAALAGCGSSGSDKASDTSPSSGGGTTSSAPGNSECGTVPAEAANFEPVVAGTLTIVTSLPGPGFWEGSDSDPTKLTSGYEYDIAKCMQADFGLDKLVVENKGFDAIVAGSLTKYDVALSQISITPERAKVVSFSEPYFESQQGILMKADATAPTTLEEAKALNWGVQSSTTAVDLLKSIGVNNPHSYADLASAYTALQADQIQAMLIDTAINLGEAARSKGVFKVVAQFNQPGGPDQYGAILPKDSANVAAVNAVFAAMTDGGQIKALADKDLTADPGTIPVIEIPGS